MTKLARIFCLLIFLSACTQPSNDPTFRADRPEKIGKQIRCPVCRGVSIADSPAELAVQMMGIVREQVDQGKSDEEILNYFESRYGEWILLQPKAQGMNWIIWLLPVALLIGGGAGIFYQTRKARKAKTS